MAAFLILHPATKLFAGAEGPPAMPPQLCEAGDEATSAEDESPGPDIAALAFDERFTIALLFGRMDKGPLADDKGTWSRKQLEQTLRAIGFEKTSVEASGWARYEGSVGHGLVVQVDLLGPAELPASDGGRAMGDAIQFAMRNHELVYVNGHSMGGAIEGLGQSDTYRSQDGDPEAYAILVLDTCWSTQHYSLAALGAAAGARRLELIANDSESVTGSIQSFTALLRGLLVSLAARHSESAQQSWSTRLQEMNRGAEMRAKERVSLVPDGRYPRPESFRLVTTCDAPTKEARLTPPPGNQSRL
jgi:hypothetical protein